MRRSKLLIPLVLLVLAGLVAVLFVDTGLFDAGPRPVEAPQASAAPTAAAPDQVRQRAGDADGAPPADGIADRRSVPASTTLSGRFVAPHGGWPGGGVALLMRWVPPPKGGLMGVFSSGMEIARRRQAGAGEDARQLEADIESWFGRADAIATAPVDPLGRFRFRDPASGSYVVQLRHDLLRIERPEQAARIELVAGQHADCGEIATVAAGSLLVVVSDESGTPIADAELTLARPFDPSAFMDPTALRDLGGLIRRMMPTEGRSDADGRCLLGGIAEDTALQLAVAQPDFVDEQRALRVVRGATTLVRVQLGRGASLRVAVGGRDGRPFEGARLRLRYLDRTAADVGAGFQFGIGQGGGSRSLEFDLETGPDGRALRHGLPPGRAELQLATPGFRRSVIPLTVPASGLIEQRCELALGATVEGVVRDEAGVGIAAARVLSLSALDQSAMGIDLGDLVGLDLLTIGAEDRGVATDGDGRFVFGGFEDDREPVQLAAVAPGFDPARIDTVVGARDVEFRLLRACNLRGRVVDARNDEPVSAFRVELRERQFLVFDLAVVGRDFDQREDGRFELSPVPRRAFELVVEAEGYARHATSVDFSRGSLDCGTIELGLPATITGLTVDADGLPIAGVAVRPSQGGPADSAMFAQLVGAEAVESDADGRFVVGGLTGRAVRLVTDREGYAPLRSRPIRIAPGETVDGVLLALTRGGSIRGEITDSDGRPHVGWRVQAEHSGGAQHAFAISGEAGDFRLEALASGTYKVQAFAPEAFAPQAVATAAADGERFDLAGLLAKVAESSVDERVVVRDGEESVLRLVHDLPTGADAGGVVRIEGRVRVGGTPLDDGIVTLSQPGSAVPRHVGSVAGGGFRIERVRPGSYRLTVRAGLFAGDLGEPRVIVVPKVALHELQIELPGGAIAGRVVDAERGEPVSAAVVMLSRPGRGGGVVERMDVGEGTALTDGAGQFRFAGLAPGSYDVVVKSWAFGAAAGRSARRSDIVLAASEQRDDLVLALAAGHGLTVRVLAGSAPCANAVVTLLGAHGAPLHLFHRGLTDREGFAEFAGLPDGSYSISVDAPAVAPAVSPPTEVRGRDERIELRLSPGVPVTLRLTGSVPAEWQGDQLSYALWRGDGALLRHGRATVPPIRAGAADQALPLGRLTPGRYHLRVEGARFGVRDEERAVVAGEPAVWTLEVRGPR